MCDECRKNKIFAKKFNQNGEIVIKNKSNTVEKVVGFTKAAVSVLNGSSYLAPTDIKKQRLLICANCDEIKRVHNLPKGADIAIGDKCGICGCYLKGNSVFNMFSVEFCKTCYIGEEFACPLKKWGFELEFLTNKKE